jgi:type I restriction enzyme S subunit
MKAAAVIALGSIMASKSGSVDPSKFPDEVFDLYSIPAFDRGQPEIVEGNKIGSTKQVVQPGDVLLSKIVPHIRRSWVVGKNHGRRLIASGEWIVFRSEHLHPRYVKHVLVGDPFYAEFMRTVSGVGGSLLRARPAQVANIKIPLPPLAEQRRIAAILDAAEALREKRRQSLAKLDSLTQAIFLGLFGDPAANPKQFQLHKFADICERIFKGAFDLKAASYRGDGIPFIRIADIQKNTIDLTHAVYIDEGTHAKYHKSELVSGDLVFSKVGTIDRIAIIPPFIPCCIISQNNVGAKLRSSLVHPSYALAFLTTPYGLGKIRQGNKKAVPDKLILEELRKLPFMLPPLKLQVEFADRISAVENLKAKQAASLKKLNELFASLQHRAFRGEL